MKIIHVNHSSLLICDSGYNLLTDPWYFTNAFEGWAPFPQPDARLIRDIVDGEYIPHVVLISHAHDDHLDERYLAKITAHTVVVIPKYANKSLKKRLISCGVIETNICEVCTEPVELFCYRISAISNQTLSKEDFIFTISTASGLAIHANDNWHPFSSDVVNHIHSIAQTVPYEKRYLFAQVGIADAFPIFYTEISDEQKYNIIFDKCNKMLAALASNGKAVQTSQLFAYANQSLFLNPVNLPFNPYEVRDQATQSFVPNILQLLPSFVITENENSSLHEDYIPLIVQRLASLTAMFQQFADSKSSASENNQKPKLLPVEFHCLEYFDINVPIKDKSIQIISSLHQWNKILSGICNLESLITGGCGRIRVLNTYNIRAEYNLLVDWSYIAQALIKSKKIFV